MLTRRSILPLVIAIAVTASVANAGFSFSIGALSRSHHSSIGIRIGSSHREPAPRPVYVSPRTHAPARVHVSPRTHVPAPVRVSPRTHVPPGHLRHGHWKSRTRSSLFDIIRPYPPIVITRPPARHRVVIVSPPAPVVVRERVVHVEPAEVIVWVRNSNNSQTAVKLNRQGPGYVGPRGEYYREMPTNEQLRVVYGF